MAHAAAIAASASCGANSSLAASLRKQQRQSLSHSGQFPVFISASRINVGGKRICRLKPVTVAGLPLLSLAAETEQYEFINKFNDWTLDAQTLKNIYLAFSLFFCWGCCVFASMKDPFYDSDTYRGAGGDGTGNWIYNLEEDEGVEAREELWREELAREIEERVGEMREIEEAKKEKELEALRTLSSELEPEFSRRLQLLFQEIMAEESSSTVQPRVAAKGLGIRARLGNEVFAGGLVTM